MHFHRAARRRWCHGQAQADLRGSSALESSAIGCDCVLLERVKDDARGEGEKRQERQACFCGACVERDKGGMNE